MQVYSTATIFCPVLAESDHKPSTSSIYTNARSSLFDQNLSLQAFVLCEPKSTKPWLVPEMPLIVTAGLNLEKGFIKKNDSVIPLQLRQETRRRPDITSG